MFTHYLLTSGQPIIVLTDGDFTGAELDQTLVISPAVMFGVPEATLTWRHNGEVLNSDTDSRVTVMPSGQLRVMDVEASDRGTYELDATNIAGTVSASINIAIDCKLVWVGIIIIA